MQEPFLDRVLRCVDCNTDFTFTAGEQLFFFDKQFKNDPKRCKPCKSRRSGLAAAAQGLTVPARATPRPETRTRCSDCGVETTVPFKPTQGRPVLCRQCFGKKSPVKPALVSAAATAHLLAEVSREDSGTMLSAEAALVAAASITSAPSGSSVASARDLQLAAGMAPVALVDDFYQPELPAGSLDQHACLPGSPTVLD